MAGKPSTTSAPRGASRRPPAANWRAELSPEDRKVADQILNRYGAPVFARLADAYAAAPRKAGAPSKADGRARLLEKMEHLLAATPPWKPWRAATQVARENATIMESAETLRRWLLRAFEKDGAARVARARAAKSRHPAFAMAAPGGRSTIILPRWARSMRDIQEIDRRARAKPHFEEMDPWARLRRHLEETDPWERAKRHLEETDGWARLRRHLEETDGWARLRRHLEETDGWARLRRHLEETDGWARLRRHLEETDG